MNIYVVNILVAAITWIVSFFIGSIPTSVIIGKVFFHKDVRQYGSKNAGGTNSARVFGKKVGVIVIILDMIKTILPFYIAWAVLTYSSLNAYMVWGNGYHAAPLYYWAAALFCAFGHCYSPFLHFKGGKAVACFMGINVLTSWIEFTLCGFTYLGVAKKSKYISSPPSSGRSSGRSSPGSWPSSRSSSRGIRTSSLGSSPSRKPPSLALSSRSSIQSWARSSSSVTVPTFKGSGRVPRDQPVLQGIFQ